MHVTFIVSRLFDGTRDFLRAVARQAGFSVTVLGGDEPLERGVRAIRFAQRIWFEGAGPLLSALARAPASWKLPRACLRAAEDEVPALPMPDLWRIVSDLIVPSQAAARAVLASMAARTPPGRVHVLGDDLRRRILGQAEIGDELARLADLLLKPPGDLAREQWESIAFLGDACRGRTLILGDAPAELAEHLARACGLAVKGAGAGAAPDGRACPTGRRAADSVVFWECLPSDGGAAALGESLACLRAGGVVAAVAPPRPASAGQGVEAVERLLRDRFAAAGAVRVESRGRVVVAAGDAAGAGIPVGPAPSVEVRPGAPFVSAVVPVYNDAARVGRAIASLRRQTYPNLEILVVDDGSTDGTAQAVGKHLNDPRVRYLYRPHAGRPGARNAGIAEARHDWIAWLDSDDESLPGRIEAQAAVVRQDPSVDLIHADGFFIRPDGRLGERRRYDPFTAEDFPRLLLAGLAGICPILNTSVMVRRDLYRRAGGYDPAWLRCEDYEFWVRLAARDDVHYAHLPHALVNVHPSPPSPQKLGEAVDYCWRLAVRIIETFGPERLMDAVARDLHESQHLAMGRSLAAVALVFRAPAGHPIYEETRRRLNLATQAAGPRDRIDAHTILGGLAQAIGDREGADACYARARDLAAAPAR